MKCDLLIEYNKRTIFYKNHGENEAEKLVPDHFVFLKKALYVIKASCMQFSFNICW